MDAQLPVRFKRVPVPVDLALVASLGTLHQAVAECARLGGLQDKVVAIETGIDPGLWSRIKSGQAGISGDFLDRLMDAAGNELPLLYQLHARGWDASALRKRESELEQELRVERELRGLAEQELETIKRFVRDTRTA